MHPTARQAAADLATIREQWGDLLAAIERPAGPAEWPPRETAAFLTGRADDGELLVADRAPLTLREHPAPLNLDALDAALAVERHLFGLADTLAAAVQRSIRHVPVPNVGRRARWVEDPADRDDPARWHLPTSRDLGPGIAASPGSRTYGLHWAAVWCEGRVLGEDTTSPRPSNAVRAALFAPLPEYLLAEAATVARSAAVRVARALGRDRRAVALDRPCPWCGGPLTGRTGPGGPDAAEVTCRTGAGCGAPVLLDDRGRRRWAGGDLPGLWSALDAEGRRAA